MSIESNRPIVVVGIDGTPNSLEALRWAADYARLSGAELRLVMAWQTLSGFGFAPISTAEWARQAEHELDRALYKALGSEPSVPITKKVVNGNPTAVLVEESTDADLLVVGDRGSEGFGGLRLGHVGENCARNAHCPVIIVRERHALQGAGAMASNREPR